MNTRTLMAAAVAATALGAFADFDINLDLSGKAIKDVRTSTCGPEIGYAGTLACEGIDETDLFDTRKEETARLMKEAGAWLQRMWGANAWYGRRGPNPYDPNSKDPKEVQRHKTYRRSDPDAAFRFWKANGFKVLFTLEAWGGEASRKGIREFVKYIIDNGYKDVVAGFELGNESYFGKPESMVPLCKTWSDVIDDIRGLWPNVPLGIPVCELFERNPDLTQVRARMLAAGEIKRDGYFSAMYCNQTSAKMVMELKRLGKLDKISHVIYHAYGAETPYSCSYYGFQRFRNFSVAFPELKGKKFWLTEVRPRSDEDNRCQRMFRESLIMSHYALMAICQPEVDGYNHHQLYQISGGLYRSTGKSWPVQWRDAGGDYPDLRSPYDRPRLEVGSMGVAYRIYTEAIKTHPLILAHGTSKEQDTEDTFFTSARVCDEVYARRRALKERRTDMFGRPDIPVVKGETEWVALASAGRDELSILMVNSKPTAETVTVRVPGRQFAAPTYRTVSCPEQFLDCRDVPGEAKPWKELAWEDTQSGYDVVQMEKFEGMEPVSDTAIITIAPHTVQSVTVMTRNAPKAK